MSPPVSNGGRTTSGAAFDALTFTPDDKTLAVVSLNAVQETVLFFDAQRGTEGRPLSASGSFGVAYARGGSLIVTTGTLPNGRGGAQLWDAATLAPIGEPLEISSGNIATFDDASPDGEHVMAGGVDHGGVTIWTVDVREWETAACNVAGRNLTQAEWREYLPDQPYRSDVPPVARRTLTTLPAP